MLDTRLIPLIRPPLNRLAQTLNRRGIRADQVTVVGFIIGMLAVPLLWMEWYTAALIAIALNRLGDGLDGAVARIQGLSDAGGFLDIVLDFIFYNAIAFGFLLANPEQNALWAGLLMFSFAGTGTTFLAFAIMANKHQLDSPNYPQKSLYYMGGLTEGTETIIAFVLFCLFPQHFPWLAGIFALMCWITTSARIRAGYTTLRGL
ncbi:CDP-alcohol phosphatidyltransferase family protein [Marinimicrobium agarilyticum]|uniref:CDP-alcohol phosphatidyltransferase family protein n=1 Tax=Marinimicrobium agarilyticum TaxID=306546 RepID=UPI0004218BDA|nr:CDP-alcohol phosphatidyltransferase family protein [Marinimicrobium agarilyticum]